MSLGTASVVLVLTVEAAREDRVVIAILTVSVFWPDPLLYLLVQGILICPWLSAKSGVL